jgi:hypothetical protein
MKWFNILRALNILLAIGLGVFAYEFLPYAKAVTCEINKAVSPCEEVSLLELVGASMVPAIVIAAFVLLASFVVKRSSQWGLGIASIPPLVVFGWYIFIATAN